MQNSSGSADTNSWYTPRAGTSVCTCVKDFGFEMHVPAVTANYAVIADSSATTAQVKYQHCVVCHTARIYEQFRAIASAERGH